MNDRLNGLPQPVRDAWELRLPRATDTLLLKACLLDAESGVAAWRHFTAQAGSAKVYFERDSRGLKGLLPYLADSLNRHQLEVDSDFLTYARVALVREELRGNIYHEILNSLCDAFRDSEIGFSLVRGAAIAMRFYPSPLARHNHAIDLVIQAGDEPQAANLLTSLGFVMEHASTYRHASGLPVVLHRKLLDHPFAKSWEPSRCNTRASSSLTATDLLLHTIGHASYEASATNLRWIVDAWYILSGAETVDWNRYINIAHRSGLAPFHAIALQYLKDELCADLDTRVIARIADFDALASDTDSYDVLFASLLIGGTTYLRILRAIRSWTPLLWRFIEFAAFPPKDYLGWRYGLVRKGDVRKWRLTRPVRVLRRVVTYPRRLISAAGTQT